jgi:hypothetical protein
VDWRKAGDIPWNAIADGSGRGVVNDFSDYKSPETWIDGIIGFLRNAGEKYREYLVNEWRWYGQPHYVEFLTEKNTVTSTIAAHTQDLYVKVSFNRGDSGWRFMYDNCERWKQELIKGKKVHVRYLGDWDTKGRDMDRQIKVQLKHFGLLSRIDFKRIGVLQEQIQEYKIPLNYDKKNKPSYEIDGLNALNETAFRDLLRSNVKPLFNESIYEKMLLRKEHSAKDIDRLVRSKITFKSKS